MKRVVFLLPLLLSFFSNFNSFSQKPTEKWYWAGSPAPAVDFSSGTPVPLFNSGITFSHESGTSLADANGNLLFYADGNAVVFNRNHVAMTNGTGMQMHNSVTQGCIFIPKPGSANIYYLFHIGKPSLGSPPFNLYYSEIDMSLSGGLGAVTANKNISIAASFNNCSEKMTATKHCNGTDIWVLVHDYSGTTYRAYLVTAAGVNTTPVVSNVGTSIVSGMDYLGQMKISPNGAKVATTIYDQGILDICDFNPSTGVVSNAISSGSKGQWMYGTEFSPDNSKVYASVGTPSPTLFQWDLCAGSPAAVIASATAVAGNANIYSMQMGPTGKIYCASGGNNLGVINNPNVSGIGCNYVAAGINVAPSNTNLGLPNFLTSYFDLPANKPQATVVPVNAGSCSGTGSATASICAVFGAAPYTYSWSNGTVVGPTTGLASTISNLTIGTYSVIVNDASCRADTAVFSITGGGNSFSVTPTSAAASCGVANGTATVSVTGGTSPYTYLWNPSSQTSSAVSGLTAGNYTVTITDAAACTQSQVINIPSAGGGSVTIASQNIICNGGNNGSATATLASGTLPYTYNWSNGASTSSATGLSVGNYTCVVTDATGCSSTQTVAITQPSAMSSSVLGTQASCGQSNAQATVIASGGNSPYSYLWSNGASTSSASGLAAGNYSVVVTDAGGCTHTASVTIVNGNGPVPSITSQTSTSCNGGSNGTATASATGGTAPYTFMWSNGASTSSATGLSAGNYFVVVTDAGGCTNSQTVTITQPNVITATTTNTPAGCGLSNGTATASGSGGTGAFTYGWSNGASTSSATGLAAGNYSVTVSDANGCTQNAIATVAQGSGPVANAGGDVTIPAGGSTPLSASGGVSYSWSPANGLSNPSVSNPTASPSVTTSYCVIVSDAGGCVDSACVTVYIELPCGEFYLPNAFSPNGDSENDEYKAYILADCVKEFKLTIYNRWGDKVFETSDVTKTWNGEYNSEPANAAVYAYYVYAVLKNGKVIDSKGNVSLVR